jgi:hypothetical protein
VLIGPESSRAKLLIHQSIVTPRSEFFANALSGRWNNSDTKTVDLYGVDPDLTFEEVAHYLKAVYTNRNNSNVLSNICRIYVVAEQLLDIQTRKLAVQALYEHIRKPRAEGDHRHLYPSPKCIRIVYKETASATDPMRRLLVDIWCVTGGSIPRLEENGEKLPKEFLLELATAALIDKYEVYGADVRGVDEPLTFDLECYFEE